jgi:hypothetical protein
MTLISRREFNKRFSGILVSIAAAGSALQTTACNAFDNIVRWVGVGIAAFTSIVHLLAGAGIVNTIEGTAITVILGLVKTGLNDVQVAIAEYDNAPAANKQTLKGKIATALQAVIDTLQKFWNDLSIPDAQFANLVQGLLGVMLAALAGFMVGLPAPVTARKSFAKMVGVVPKKQSSAAFVKEFNGLLAQGGYSQYSIQ